MISDVLKNILQNPDIHNLSHDEILQLINAIYKANTTSSFSSTGILGYNVYISFHKYVAPFIFFIGLTGNILNFFVLRKTAMLKIPTSFFLQALSVFDTMILIFGLLPEWTSKAFNFNFQLQSDILCKFFNYLLYTSSQISAWLVVVMTINRYILVCRPLLAITECTSSKSRKQSLIVILIFLIINTHFFLTVGLTIDQVNGKFVCEGLGKFKYFTAKILPLIDGALYAIIPSVIIITLNNLIILKYKSRDIRRTQNYVDNQENRLTYVFLLVSICFVVASVPVAAIMITIHYWNNLHQVLPNSVWIVRGLSDMLMYLNHSINIFLYSLSGTKFREVLSQMLMLQTKRTNNIRATYKHANKHDVVTETSV